MKIVDMNMNLLNEDAEWLRTHSDPIDEIFGEFEDELEFNIFATAYVGVYGKGEKENG